MRTACPKCESEAVFERRGEEGEVLELGTACGSRFYRDTVEDRPEQYQVGWNHYLHGCRLVNRLNAKIHTVTEERDEAREQLRVSQAATASTFDQLTRARRMLLATGMNEALVDAALDEVN